MGAHALSLEARAEQCAALYNLPLAASGVSSIAFKAKPGEGKLCVALGIAECLKLAES